MSLPISMLLKNLIKNVSSDDKNIVISGLSTNSKYIKKNYIFFAIKGNKLNGENFIKEAINKGASVIISSKKCKFVSKEIPIINNAPIFCTSSLCKGIIDRNKFDVSILKSSLSIKLSKNIF